MVTKWWWCCDGVMMLDWRGDGVLIAWCAVVQMWQCCCAYECMYGRIGRGRIYRFVAPVKISVNFWHLSLLPSMVY